MCWLMPTIPTFRGGWRFPSEYSLGCIRKNSPTRPCFKNNIFNWRKENILQVVLFLFVFSIVLVFLLFYSPGKSLQALKCAQQVPSSALIQLLTC